MARLQKQFESATVEWPTPDSLWKPLHEEFGFTLDVCATDENAKCPRYYTRADYGLEQTCGGDNVAALHLPFLAEAKRVLRPDGLIFAKIKDYIHNHRYQWNLEYFNAAVRAVGLTPCDLIIKRDPCGGNLKSGRWKTAHHAKNCHCYWVVVRNGRCEPRLVSSANKALSEVCKVSPDQSSLL